MTRNEVRAKVVDILVENLGIEETEATDETELKLDLGADELDIVEIALAIEEEFDFEMFDDEQIRERTTVGELVDLARGSRHGSTGDTAMKLVIDLSHIERLKSLRRPERSAEAKAVLAMFIRDYDVSSPFDKLEIRFPLPSPQDRFEVHRDHDQMKWSHERE